jgi:glycosyltransferase involved in cell wall biosynthesis
MTNNYPRINHDTESYRSISGYNDTAHQPVIQANSSKFLETREKTPSGLLLISSYPPRECGIATYSQDLIKALNNKFSHSLQIKVCALESGKSNLNYPNEVKYIIDTTGEKDYQTVIQSVNADKSVKIVLVQHEFGFFAQDEESFTNFLFALTKPVILVFHTVLPHPDEQLEQNIKNIVSACSAIVVMTRTSADILVNDYHIPLQKITVIPHGVHLVPHLSKKFLKKKYNLVNKKVLTTFGLLSSGKSIETTLKALPFIAKQFPDVLFLIIGKTHPEVVKSEGESYRQRLEKMVVDLNIQNHVRFINQYLELPVLLEYLQLTDIYLFTSNDPNQAVSGTFVYAMSCACPIISTPIPHAKEVLSKETGIIFDFGNSEQLSNAVIKLFDNESLRRSVSSNTLQKVVSSAWENSAVAHIHLFEKISNEQIIIKYNLPVINLSHLKKMTNETGMIQFARMNQPDIKSGYTLDDNTRALIALSMYYSQTRDAELLPLISIYLRFIGTCLQSDNTFLNYMNKELQFTEQNLAENLDDSNGRAIWGLGYVISQKEILPFSIIEEASLILSKATINIERIHSTRAMAFIIKGLYQCNGDTWLPRHKEIVLTLSNRLLKMYQHEAGNGWNWFESYLTYANSVIPEAMLYAWQLTKDPIYKEIAITSFNFLLSHIFNKNGIEVISNRNWLQKDAKASGFGEQPIDVAYTIMTLDKFYETFQIEEYRRKIEIAFNWFLGSNRLHQIIYNPCTGGCHDGLEETHVNLNQGAESTISYLMARLTVEKRANYSDT